MSAAAAAAAVSLPSQTGNTNRRVERPHSAASGDRAPLFLLEKHCAEKTGRALDHWLRALRYLKATGCYDGETCFLVRDPLHGRVGDGDGDVGDGDVGVGVVLHFDWVEGEAGRLPLAPRRLHKVAEALARLHNVPLSTSATNEDVVSIALGGASDVCRLADMATDPRVEDPVYRQYLQETLPQLPRHDEPSLPWAVLHTDVFPDNVLFDDDRDRATLVDFEEVCAGPRVLDLAVALVGCCRRCATTSPSDTKNTAAGLDADQTRRFVAAYRAALNVPMQDSEASALVAFVRLACVNLGAWRYRHFNIALGQKEHRGYLEMVHLERWVAAQNNAALFFVSES